MFGKTTLCQTHKLIQILSRIFNQFHWVTDICKCVSDNTVSSSSAETLDLEHFISKLSHIDDILEANIISLVSAHWHLSSLCARLKILKQDPAQIVEGIVEGVDVTHEIVRLHAIVGKSSVGGHISLIDQLAKTSSRAIKTRVNILHV